MRFILLMLLVSTTITACGDKADDKSQKLSWKGGVINKNFSINAIACGSGETVVSVGNDGYVSVSTNNGYSWNNTFRINNKKYDLHDIAYCNDQFYAVGDNATVFTYADNKSNSDWNSFSPDNFTEIDYLSVACDNNTIVIGGKTNLSSEYDNRTVVSSDKGKKWYRYSARNAIANTDMVGVENLFYTGNRFYIAASGGIVGYSASGSSWTRAPLPVGTNYTINSVATGTLERKINKKSVTFNIGIIGATQTNTNSGAVIFNNDNLSEWLISSPDGSPPIRGVASSGDYFVAITDNATYVIDNITNDNTSLVWKENNFPKAASSDNITAFTYCNGYFWIGTDKGQVFRSSY